MVELQMQTWSDFLLALRSNVKETQHIKTNVSELGTIQVVGNDLARIGPQTTQLNDLSQWQPSARNRSSRQNCLVEVVLDDKLVL